MAGTYEEELLRTQLKRGVSIFACDGFAAFSNASVVLGAGPAGTAAEGSSVETSVLDTSLSSGSGKIEHILNTQIFMEAWDKVLVGMPWRSYDWFVKADPDAVFFPSRLRANLVAFGAKPDASLYFLNCEQTFGLYGALEVFSRGALAAYSGSGVESCKDYLNWKVWGEDLFMRKCMDYLGADHVDNFELLDDAYCGAHVPPCTSRAVSFHPLKSVYDYFQCVDAAESAEAAGFQDRQEAPARLTGLMR